MRDTLRDSKVRKKSRFAIKKKMEILHIIFLALKLKLQIKKSIFSQKTSG